MEQQQQQQQEILVSSDNRYSRHRQPSEHLQQAIDNCVSSFHKTKDAVNIALEIGQKEGFSW